MWMAFPKNPVEALFYMILMALLVVVVFVDAELMVIPLQVTWLGTALGLVAAVLVQHHLYLDGEAQGWKHGLWTSVSRRVPVAVHVLLDEGQNLLLSCG